MKKLAACLLMVMAVALSLSADIYVKTKSHSDAMTMMGQTQPAKDSFNETWFAEDKMAMLAEGQIYIVDLKKNMMFIVNVNAKSYVESTLPLDIAKLLPPEMAAMAGMLSMTATVNATGEKKKIGNWNCQGFDVKMTIMGMAMPMKIWASADVPFDTSKYMALFSNVLKGQMRLDDASVKEFQKIKGFQIASEVNAEMMGAKIRQTTEVVEISQKAAPAGTFAPPAGFTKKDKLSMEELNKR